MRIALIGNPNAGKSTLFNALTGGSAMTGNYPGTTVGRTSGEAKLGDWRAEIVDVPGTFSLVARSPEERIAIDTALGLDGGAAPSLLVVVIDTPRLMRSLYLLLQLLDLHVPIVAALNLMDEARSDAVVPDVAALQRELGVPVVPIVARSGEGLTALRDAITDVLAHPSRGLPGPLHAWPPPILADAKSLAAALPERYHALVADHPQRARAIALWMLLSADAVPDAPHAQIAAIHASARAAGRDVQAEIVGPRYAWIDDHAAAFLPAGRGAGGNVTDRIDRVLLHPVWGALVFFAVMAVVFQALFAWSDPAINAIDHTFRAFGSLVAVGFARASAAAPLGGATAIVGDLLVQGIIGGVGSVLVFIPQIALLFFFVAILEDSGYLARAAHLMDRVLRTAGLPGRAFVPLLSGFACAVPAILATRTMPRARDRMLTMAVIPLTSCSARLPVYALMIGALFPEHLAGSWVPVRPVALFGMYAFSTLMTLLAATVLGRTVVRDVATPDLIELPPYRMPHWRTVGRLVWSRVGEFIREAGRVILVATVALWALLSFPRYSVDDLFTPGQIAQAHHDGKDIDALARGAALERSVAGRIGKTIEPAIAPLGFDWRIGVGLIGAFAAREVFVSTMGVVYGLGDDVDETSSSLRDRLREELRDDGTPRYTPLVATSLMVFFALAFQCLSTLAVLRREAGGWRWPLFTMAYMSALAWTSSLAVYQLGLLAGFK